MLVYTPFVPASDPQITLPIRRYPTRYIAPLLVVLTLLMFGRSVTFDFVRFDDDLHVVANPLLHPITAAHLQQFWLVPYRGVYMPITYMTWAAIAQLGQVPTPDARGTDFNPYLFHLMNIVLHVASVLLVWRVLVRVMTNSWAAAAGAAVFAVHPFQVESVAWVSSGKDALGGLFAIASMLLYLRFAQRGSWMDYASGLFVFALALLSKATSCMAPAILLILLTIAPLANRRRAMLWLWPWCLMVIPMVLITHRAQEDAALFTWNPPWARPLVAVDAIAFYAGKLLCPMKLAVDYGRTPRWVVAHPAWTLWLLPILMLVAAVVWRRRWPWGLSGLAIVLMALLPVLGLVPFEFQAYSTVADRYMYLPMLGVAIIVAGVAGQVRMSRGGIFIIAIVTVLSIMAFVQTGVWASSETLYQHAVEVQPRSGFGWQGVGDTRGRAGDWPGAVDAYQRALAIRPDDLQAIAGLANAYKQAGDATNYRRAYAAMSYEAARRVLLKDPANPIALRRMQQATTQPR